MSYSIYVTDNFSKELKRLIPKYPSLKADLEELSESLKEHPRQGKTLKRSCRKVHLYIPQKEGSRKGRITILTRILVESVFLISIYDKSVRIRLGPYKIHTALEAEKIFY